MLSLRLQRTGRKKMPHYRLIAQEHRRQPTSGKVAAHLGHYNPHTKEAVLDKEKIEYYLKNGAQPSNSVAKLLKKEGVKLPDWVEIKSKPAKEQPAEESAEEADAKEEAATEEKPSEESSESKEEQSEEDKSDNK